MTSRLLALFGCTMMVTACGAPRAEQAFGVRPFDTNVQLGSQATPSPAAAPVVKTLEPPGFPAPFTVPPISFGTSDVPPSPPENAPRPGRSLVGCRRATVTDYPKQEASENVTGQPATGTYSYRQTGKEAAGGKTATLPPTFDRTVSDVNQTSDATGITRLRYTATDRLPDGTTQATTYETESGSTEAASDGIYLTSQTESDPSGQVVGSFNPADPILLMQTPAEGTTSSQGWASAGTDPLTGVAMSVQGLVAGRERVDACGTVIDAWKVTLIGDVLRGSPDRDHFTATFNVATQLGGLFVGERADLTRTSGNTATFESHSARTIDADHPQKATP